MFKRKTFAAGGLALVGLLAASAPQSALAEDCPPSEGPEATAQILTQDPVAGSPATFDGSLSDGGVLTVQLPGNDACTFFPVETYTWDWGDGSATPATTPIVEHTYAEAGAYPVKLTVESPMGTDDTQGTIVVDEAPGGPPTGPAADTAAPETKIDKAPPGKVSGRRVTVKFSADETGSTFECKLDKGSWKRCASPRKVKAGDAGRHALKVRATDLAGNTDPTPAKARWRVSG